SCFGSGRDRIGIYSLRGPFSIATCYNLLIFGQLSLVPKEPHPMVLAVAHLFGFYNPKQLADFLEVPHQQFYTELKDWSVYHVKKMLLRFMVKQAAEK